MKKQGIPLHICIEDPTMRTWLSQRQYPLVKGTGIGGIGLDVRTGRPDGPFFLGAARGRYKISLMVSPPLLSSSNIFVPETISLDAALVNVTLPLGIANAIFGQLTIYDGQGPGYNELSYYIPGVDTALAS